MFNPAGRRAHVSQQGDAARQAKLVLRDKRELSLTLEHLQGHLLLFSEEVFDFGQRAAANSPR